MCPAPRKTDVKEEYYSAIKNNEIMPRAATWIDLKIIILNEVGQIKNHMVLFAKSKKKKKKKWTIRKREWTICRREHTDIEKQAVVTKDKREGLWLFSC